MKTEAGRREVILGPSVAKLLRECWLATSYKAPDAFVFANGLGRLLDYRDVGKGFRSAVERSGVTAAGRLSLHSLRHGFASLLIAKGLDVVFVSRQLGHANPKIVRLYIDREPSLGSLKLRELTMDHVAAWSRANETRVPRTARMTLVTLNQVCRFAVRRGWLADNPVGKLEPAERPRRTRQPVAILEGEELARLLSEAGSYRTLFEFLAYTGLRIGEALGLCWADIDFDAGLIRVHRQLRATASTGRSRPRRAGARSSSPRRSPSSYASTGSPPPTRRRMTSCSPTRSDAHSTTATSARPSAPPWSAAASAPTVGSRCTRCATGSPRC